MRNYYFKTSDPLSECIGLSNIDKLELKDKEYTKKANEEGSAFYKWNTDLMTVMIYQNGIDDINEISGPWGFISRWLALTLKFVDDEKIQYYMEEFYKGKIHYTDMYYDKTLYEHMYNGPSSYVYNLYKIYLENNNEKLPDYILKLKSFYIPGFDIREKIPSKNGLSLIYVGREKADKYNNLWISPEEEKENKIKFDKKCNEFLEKRKRGEI